MRDAISLGRSERGAVKIQTVLILALVAVGAFLLIKIIPVYVEQQKIVHEVDELARISAVRGYKEDKVEREILKLVGDFSLPEDSISYNIKDRKVKITLGYKRDIDLLVTTYSWQVAHEVEGKEL